MARPKQLNTNQGVNKLAIELGISAQTVSRKRKQGKSDAQIRKEAAEWKSKDEKASQPDGKESKWEAERRKEVALADLRELELAVKRGELVEVAKVNAFVSGMIIKARDILTRISNELSDRLAVETSPIRVRELIDVEVNRALTQLSIYKQ